MNMSGYEKLWAWFSCSRASWITIPRTMAHDMPDDWQMKLAELLNEYDETWDSSEMPEPYVTARKGGRFVKWPEWLINYRRPNIDAIRSLKKTG